MMCSAAICVIIAAWFDANCAIAPDNTGHTVVPPNVLPGRFTVAANSVLGTIRVGTVVVVNRIRHDLELVTIGIPLLPRGMAEAYGVKALRVCLLEEDLHQCPRLKWFAFPIIEILYWEDVRFA